MREFTLCLRVRKKWRHFGHNCIKQLGVYLVWFGWFHLSLIFSGKAAEIGGAEAEELKRGMLALLQEFSS